MASILSVDFWKSVLGGAPTAPEGIILPNSAKAGANVLDWYEEGVWTPVLTCDTPGSLAISFTTQLGWFTRVGRLIYAQFNVAVNTLTLGTATGGLRVTGLPYPQNSAAGSYAYGSAYPIFVDLGGTPATFICGIAPGESFLYFRGPQTNTTPLVPVIGGVAAGDQLLGSIVYNAG